MTRSPKPASGKSKASKKRRTGPAISPETANRLARRKRRHDLSREEILAAARRVLLKRGIAATTLDAVAKEAGMSKTALYYYYPSKDALFFELVFGMFERQAHAVHDAVETTRDGADSLRAIIRESVNAFAPHLDDFRLAYLYGQATGQGAVHFDKQQFARIRPLNELWFAGAAKKLSEDMKDHPSRAGVEPRVMAFLAYLAAIGLLTMKGMVESLDDPLIYSDEQLVEGFARIFEAAARP
jgi:AcrR family transcriptional regulator